MREAVDSIQNCATGSLLDLGDGVTAEMRFVDGVPAGVAYWHLCHGVKSEGWAQIAPGHWEIEQAEPLTISPSLYCRACGHHGFIRDGRWLSPLGHRPDGAWVVQTAPRT